MTTRPAAPDSDAKPAPHAHRMSLWGAPDAAEFPPLCPHCGSTAASRLTLAKGFRRASGSDTPDGHAVISVAVPFCDACIARHRAELRAPDLLSRLLTGFHSGDMFAAVGFAVATAFTGFHALDDLLRGRVSHAAVWAALTAFFGLIARFEGRQAWRDTEYFRVPEPTTVSRAFDYSDNEPAPFESPKYQCTMRDERFAAAFKALNQQREFQPGSPAAVADRRQANRQTWIIGLIVAAIALFFALRDYLK